MIKNDAIGNNKTKNGVMGMLSAALVIALLGMIFFLFQANFTPMNTAENYLIDTNYPGESNGLFALKNDSEEDYSFKFDFPEEYDAIMVEIAASKGVEIYLERDGERMNEDVVIKTDGYREIIDLRGIEGEYDLRLILKKDSYVYPVQKPLFGKYDYLLFFSSVAKLFNDEVAIILAALALVFGILFVAMNRKMKYGSAIYKSFAIAMFGYAISYFIYEIVLYDLYYSLLQTPENALLPAATGIVTGFVMYLSTVFICFGLEKFVTGQIKLAKTLLGLNILLAILSIFMPYSTIIQVIVNYLFLIYISWKSGIRLFTFLAFLGPFNMMLNYFSSTIMPRYSLDFSTIINIILISIFTGYFVKEFLKNSKVSE